jgi:hypothetical protein
MPKYYRKSIRKNGRVTSIYVGGGCAELLYEMDAIERQAKEAERQQLREWRDEQTSLYRAEQQRGRGLLAITTVTLEGLGFARYARNPWKRRQMKALPIAVQKKAKAGVESLIPDLVTRINDGDSQALEQLRQLSAGYPEEVATAFAASLERMAEHVFVTHEIPGETADELQDELIAQMRLKAAELAGDNPSAAISTCAKAAAFAWAEHWILTMQAGGAGVRSDSPESMRRRNAAHKRLMVGLRTLAQIRQAESRTKRTIDGDWTSRFGSLALNGG